MGPRPDLTVRTWPERVPARNHRPPEKATKTAVYTDAALLDGNSFLLAAVAVPLMAAGTASGRLLDTRVGERGFALLFWAVMAGSSIRILTIVA